MKKASKKNSKKSTTIKKMELIEKLLKQNYLQDKSTANCDSCGESCGD